MDKIDRICNVAFESFSKDEIVNLLQMALERLSEEDVQAVYDTMNLEPNYDEPEYDDSCGMTDMEADADVLRNAGMGTDEDYGLFHDDYEEHYYDHFERDHDEPYEG